MVKGADCKSAMRRFESARRLHSLRASPLRTSPLRRRGPPWVVAERRAPWIVRRRASHSTMASGTDSRSARTTRCRKRHDVDRAETWCAAVDGEVLAREVRWCSPIGRGGRLKIGSVGVRIPPPAPTPCVGLSSRDVPRRRYLARHRPGSARSSRSILMTSSGAVSSRMVVGAGASSTGVGLSGLRFLE